MKFENEITVKINCSYDELTRILKQKGFEIKREYNLKDTYMVKKDIDIEKIDEFKLFSDYLLVRNVDNEEFQITRKYKEYNEDGSIRKNGKTNCDVYGEDSAINLLKEIGYKVLFVINCNNKVYFKDDIILIAQEVNNNYISMEYEGKEGKTIEQLISEFEQLEIPYDKSEYFLNKAIIELNKLKSKKK